MGISAHAVWCPEATGCGREILSCRERESCERLGQLPADSLVPVAAAEDIVSAETVLFLRPSVIYLYTPFTRHRCILTREIIAVCAETGLCFRQGSSDLLSIRNRERVVRC